MRYFLTSLLLIMQGCSEPIIPVVGGSCNYKSSVETVEIISISDVNSSDRAYISCEQNAVKVMFTFKPSSTLGSMLNSNMPWSLYDTVGQYTSAKYIESKGLTIGSRHKVKVDSITSGACTPILFKFIDVDFLDRENHCKTRK